jgi:hypothetical protein
MTTLDKPHSLVKDWFAAEFSQLAPQIQQLHLYGGRLVGEVAVAYGKGLAGMLGRRLANKLGIPDAGEHHLVVDISHHADGLHWDRTFDNKTIMRSTFKPVGVKTSNGYWLEHTGPVEIRLTVDIREGGWYWRILGYRVRGLRLPVWLFPGSQAYKFIEAGDYRFYVAFHLPLLGKLVSYGGVLQLA